MNQYNATRSVRQSLEDIAMGASSSASMPAQVNSNGEPCQVVVVKDSAFPSNTDVQVGAVRPTQFTAIDTLAVRPQGQETINFSFTNGTPDDLNIYFGTKLGIAGGWAKTFGAGTSLSSADYALFVDQNGAATAKLQGLNDIITTQTPILISKIAVFSAIADNLREQELKYISLDLNGNTCNQDTYVPPTYTQTNGVEYDAKPGFFALGAQVGYAYELPAGKSIKVKLVVAASATSANFSI